MTWFKVDDAFAFHPKVMSVGNAALGMWVRAGAWSAHQLTDGFIPNTIIVNLGGAQLAHRLVEASLWIPMDGGFQFHDWADWQPTRERVLTARKETNLRQQKSREQRLSNGHVTRDRPVTDA